MSIGTFFQKMQFAAKTGQTIKEPERVANILRIIQKKREPINFSFRGLPETYSSTILKIADDHSYILIDELYPERGNELLQSKRPFTLYSTCNGVPTTFKTEFVKQGTDKEGVTFHAMTMPEQVCYQQRRNAVRIFIPEHMKMPVSLFSKGSAMFQGTLNDLSYTGLSARFNSNLDEEIRTEGTHASVVIRINSTTNITCPIKIMNSSYSAVKQESRIGAKFIDLDRATEKTIFALLNSLQRKLHN